MLCQLGSGDVTLSWGPGHSPASPSWLLSMENLGFPSTPCVTAKPLAIVVKPKIVTFSDFSVYAALQHKICFFSAVERIAAARCEVVCSFFGGGRNNS